MIYLRDVPVVSSIKVKRKRRRPGYQIYSIILLACMLLMSGCLSRSGGAPVDPVNITLAAWAETPQDFATYNRLIDTFNAHNRDVKVKVILAPHASYNEKMLAMDNAGDPPDLLWLDHLADWAHDGRLVDLSSQLERDPDWKAESYVPNALDLGKYNGRQYALPSTVSTWMIAYNKDIFDAAGMQYPQPDWTYTDFKRIAGLLNHQPQQVGITNLLPLWPVIVTSNGGSIIDPTTQTFRLDQPDATEALQQLATLSRQNRPAGASVVGVSMQPAERDLFRLGKAAMSPVGPWQFADLRANLKFNWDVVPLPRGKAVARSPLLGIPIGITAKSKYIREAYRVLLYLAFDPEVQRMQSRFGAAPPSITDKEAQAAFYMVPVAPPGATVSIQAMEKGVWIPPEFTIPGYYRALVPINKALDAIFNGRETAEQAMRDAVPEANRLLQGYGR